MIKACHPYPMFPYLWIQTIADQKYFFNSRNFKKTNLPRSRNCLHSIYIVHTTICIVFALFYYIVVYIVVGIINNLEMI